MKSSRKDIDFSQYFLKNIPIHIKNLINFLKSYYIEILKNSEIYIEILKSYIKNSKKNFHQDNTCFIKFCLWNAVQIARVIYNLKEYVRAKIIFQKVLNIS